MAINKLPPIPFQTPIADQNGIVRAVWSDWFKQLFLRAGGNLGNSGDFAGTQAASGYQKLPSGLYIQWGQTGSIASATNSTISFPVAFPTACFSVVASPLSNAAGVTTDTGHWGTSGYSASSFSLNNRTTAAYAFSWMAVGN